MFLQSVCIKKVKSKIMKVKLHNATKSVLLVLDVHLKVLTIRFKLTTHYTQYILYIWLAIHHHDPDGRCFHAAWAVSKSAH